MEPSGFSPEPRASGCCRAIARPFLPLPFRVAKIRPAARRHTEGVAVALHLLGHVAERIEREGGRVERRALSVMTRRVESRAPQSRVPTGQAPVDAAPARQLDRQLRTGCRHGFTPFDVFAGCPWPVAPAGTAPAPVRPCDRRLMADCRHQRAAAWWHRDVDRSDRAIEAGPKHRRAYRRVASTCALVWHGRPQVFCQSRQRHCSGARCGGPGGADLRALAATSRHLNPRSKGQR